MYTPTKEEEEILKDPLANMPKDTMIMLNYLYSISDDLEDMGNLPKFKEDPSVQAQIYLVQKNPLMVNCFQNPPALVKWEAFKLNFEVIYGFTTAPLEMQLIACQKDRDFLKSWDNKKTYNEVIDIALSKSGHNIKYIRKPSKQQQLTAVKKTAGAIQHIIDPDEEVQLAAVSKAWSSINFIRKPTDSVKMLAALKK